MLSNDTGAQVVRSEAWMEMRETHREEEGKTKGERVHLRRGAVNVASGAFLVKVFMRHLKYSFRGDKLLLSVGRKAAKGTASVYFSKRETWC